MSRPRILKLKEGEVSLQGFPKETADALSSYIKSFGNVVTPATVTTLSSTPAPIETSAPTSNNSSNSPLLGRAIGTIQHGKDFYLVTLAYDLDTKESKILTEQKLLSSREAPGSFKVAADKLRFV
jgi:hypothetical protein